VRQNEGAERVKKTLDQLGQSKFDLTPRSHDCLFFAQATVQSQ
jgi:hypothetical protein